jgi:DNA polymerase-3 subunit epsilon
MSPLWRREKPTSPAASAYAAAKPPPHDTEWDRAAYAVVDLEMTGLDPAQDEIISFSAVPIDAGRIATAGVRTITIRPERMPTANTIRVHGLRPADLTDAPPLAESLDPMLEALTGRLVVAHPAWVERGFLQAAFKQAGVRVHEPILDTARLASHVLAPKEEPAEMTLARAVRAMGLPIHRPHHAEGDALTTAQLFLALVTRLSQRERQTVGSLGRLSGAPKH